MELTWLQESSDEQTIDHYRIFVQEKDKTSNPLSIETKDDETRYVLMTPRSMWGKTYIVNVQAVNNKQRVSPLSELAVFTVDGFTKNGEIQETNNGTMPFAPEDDNDEKD